MSTRKPQTIEFWWSRLPHWEVEDGRYFVTIHLRGAIPAAGVSRIHELAQQFDRSATVVVDRQLQLHRQIFQEIESWLDTAQRDLYLQQPAIAEMVVEAIENRQNRFWNMFEYVVMPNHVHLFFEIVGPKNLKNDESRLKYILEDFKRWTGHQAARLIDLRDDRFWQDEWFDHWSRSDLEDDRISTYMQRNPEKAGLVADYHQWEYGGWNRSL